ncbi:ABC transporter permease [Chloroflexota bacterium]
MNFGVIKALVAKDFSLFFRNHFYAYVTAISLIFYLVIYFAMPASVDETLEVGLYAPVLPPVFELIQQDEGIDFIEFESDAALRQAVNDGEYQSGIFLPADILEKFAAGEKPQVTLYFAASAVTEIKDAIEVMIRELSYQQTGQSLAIDVSYDILGPDLAGEQIPPRDRLRLMLVIALVVFEMMGLASLIVEEVEQGTIRGLLVTPMSVRDFFAAKLIIGTILAFTQGLFFMAIVGGLSTQPLIIITALFLGSILFTGSGFLIASLSRDMMSSMGWGIIAILIYTIPAFGIMFPGTVTGWTKLIPSYYLADTIHRASNFNAGWGDNWSNLLILLGFIALVVSGGIMALRRKFR